MDPKDYIVTVETEVGEVDLDQTPHYLADGTRLTEEKAAELGEKAAAEYARRRGRPSLSGSGTHSPRVSVRLPDDVYGRFTLYAKATNQRVSDLAREALLELDEKIRAELKRL